MIQAATLSFEDAADRMRTIVARNAAPSGCWIITVPTTDERGTAWQKVLGAMWASATFNHPTRLRLAFSELAEMKGERRVLVLVGVRRT